MPTEIAKRWNELQSFLLNEGDDWQVWRDWYQARLDGGKTIDVPSDLLETLDVGIATLDEELWQQGPAEVNAKIQELMADAFERDQELKAAEMALLEDILQEETTTQKDLQQLNQYADTIPYGLNVSADDNYFSFTYKQEENDLDAALKLTQNESIEEAKEKLQRLSGLAARLANQQIWEDLPKVTNELLEWFSREPSEMAQSVMKAWHLSVSLGTFLEQNDEITQQGDRSTYDPLELDIKRSLVDANATISTIIREFPTGEKEDEKHHKWRQNEQEFNTIKDVVTQISQHGLLIEEHAKILALAIKRSDLEDTQGKKNASFATGTAKKVALGAAALSAVVGGGIVGGATGDIGAEIAKQTGLSKKATEFIIASPDELREAFKDTPADIRATIEEILKQAKNK